jgi:hypothetical protein
MMLLDVIGFGGNSGKLTFFRHNIQEFLLGYLINRLLSFRFLMVLIHRNTDL